MAQELPVAVGDRCAGGAACPLTEMSKSCRMQIPGGPRRRRGWVRQLVTWLRTLPIRRGAAERWPGRRPTGADALLAAATDPATPTRAPPCPTAPPA